MKKLLAILTVACMTGIGGILATGCGEMGDPSAQQYTVTVESEDLDKGTATVSGDATVENGENVTVTATAKNGYKFVGWYEGDTLVSTETTYTFALTETFTLTARFEEDNTGDPLQQFTGLSLASLTETYDGTEKEVLVSGTIPEGADVQYTSNKATDAGTYDVTAVISLDGYETLTLTATLTINPATFTNITFEDKTFWFGSGERELLVSGTLPEGTTVDYQNNKGTEIGTYNATATISNPNYVTLTLNATLKIKQLDVQAVNIINSLLERPDPWAFMPEAFKPEKMAYSALPVGGKEGSNSFATNTNVNLIGKRAIGKQFNVLYDALNFSSTIIGGVDKVYEAGGLIASVYQAFINDNPDGYADFTGSAGGFGFKIHLDGAKREMLAGNDVLSAELTYDSETGARTGRIQLTDGTAIKYESDSTQLKLAYKMTVAGVGCLTRLEFVRNDNAVAGYLYEHMGAETTAIKTSAVIASDSQYTRICSNKRETDDLLINGYEEVYSSETGEMVGSRVVETVNRVDFDTLWLNVYDVAGINSVCVKEEANGLNADSLFVNGSTTALETKKVGVLGGLRMESRRYDIEMKEVWYVVSKTEGEETTYSTEKTLIPMLFVQYEESDDFAEDIMDKNSYLTDVSLPETKVAAVNALFETMKTTFEAIKENMDYLTVNGYIGTKDSFFDTLAVE